MEERIIEVTAFTGQTYGYNGEIRISLHYEKLPIRFKKGTTKKHGPYHFDNEDIAKLTKEFPEYLPQKENDHYQGYVTEWGYDIEEGLCQLMIEGKLKLKRTEYGKEFMVKYSWIGEPWDAERKGKKRRFQKLNNFFKS